MGALRRVAVVFTGGTISMVVDPVAGGAVPALDGAAILARTPGLDRIARVVAVDRGLKPASHWTLAETAEVALAVRTLLDDDAIDGLVLVQGTDTLDETSFALDLLVDSPKPVVVTGAMRNATAPDYDGPANLRDAVAVAASPAWTGCGVVVVLAGTIEPADDVTKTHASALDTFRSLNAGRLGRVDAGVVVLERPRGPRRVPVATDILAGPIPIITATVGMDASILDAVLALGAAGIVVAATGSGNTSPELLAAGERAIGAGVPVVLASRTAAGAAGTDYAFPGGGATWIRAGAMLCGTLTAPKARIALSVGLGAGLRGQELARFLAGPRPATTTEDSAG